MRGGVKIRVEVIDIDGLSVADREFPLDEFTSKVLGQNQNSQVVPSIRVSLIHEEPLTTVTVPPGIRPGS